MTEAVSLQPSSVSAPAEDAALPKVSESAVTTTGVHYFSTRQVDPPAKLLDAPDLVIPEVAYKERIRGMVRLRVYIGASGSVDLVEVIEAFPPGVYDDVVARVVAGSRYAPARIVGRAVPSVREIEVPVDPYETIDRP